MFLTSLSMRGFKSFADRTLLEVEPGITVIVGPNGSGKSNVVDALAWVLGTHSAKKVRGGAMSDVIFAGSPSRTRAGHARVEIAIDNSDGRLSGGGIGTAASAAAFSEVRVARTIHADGETGYEINGEQVRALDVQELLSDTGLGRELHTIVGQGQLDEILNAKPEERRRYIEEAAGILKHRRRRERALTKLEQVDAHIDKLRTVLRELRRQLRPLERQAEAADRYAALQADLRDVRVRLAAAELDRLTRLSRDQGRDGDQAAAAQREADQRLAAARERAGGLEQRLARAEPAAERARATYYELTSLAERLRGTRDLVEAKRRHLVEYVDEPLAGRPPDDLRDQASGVDAERVRRQEVCDQHEARFREATSARREAETARRSHEQQLQASRRRRAEQREHLLRWEGEVSALRGAIASSEAELGRVSAALTGLDARIAEAERAVGEVETEIQTLDSHEVEVSAALEAAEAEVEQRRSRVAELAQLVARLESERASLEARAEALRAAALEVGGGTAALLDAGLEGVLGPLADHVRVEGSRDAALAAALGALGEAVVVGSPERASRVVSWLRSQEAGSAMVLALGSGGSVSTADPTTERLLQESGAVPAGSLLTPADDSETAEAVVGAVRRVLADTFLATDWEQAVTLHGRHPGLTFVTPEGDSAGPYGYRAGGAPGRSPVLAATGADEAEQRAAQLSDQLSELASDRTEAQRQLAGATEVLEAATARINESDARITGAAERLARLNRELHTLAKEREVVASQRSELQELLDRDRVALSELHGRGPQAPPDAPEDGPDEQAAQLEEAVEEARELELDARVQLERATEQVRHLEMQAAALRREADEVEAALAEAARRRERRRQGIRRCGELALVATSALEALESSVADAEQERDQRRQELEELRQSLSAATDDVARASEELDELKERRHAADLRQAEVASRLENLTARVRSELSLSPDEIEAEHPEASSYDPDALTEREDVLVRKVGLLGRVNPLALEEFKALEERHAFLSDQLDDLRRSRKDLEQVVGAVDERIREVFREAFEDVAREFELTFQTVFPGGHGRLVLTDSDDLLTAGIDVEARPPGKKVTRLSLLSGGERSLTVLAFVFAIFRARPSPFYVLDEVDAALDDVNLQRLLRVIRSFRGHAQVIMVTHQKRSMEIADVLYGITMGPDAVTKVVAERLRESAERGQALEHRASDAPTEAIEEPVDVTATGDVDADDALDRDEPIDVVTPAHV